MRDICVKNVVTGIANKSSLAVMFHFKNNDVYTWVNALINQSKEISSNFGLKMANIAL